MKYCEEYAALLDLYVDGELTAEETLQVEAHLDTCADCRAYVDDALAMHAAFADLGEVEVPEGFAEAVCAAIIPRKAKKPMHWGRTLASLAACCAVVILLRYGPVGGKGGASAPAAMEKSTAAFDFATADAAPMESVMEETEAGQMDDAKKNSAAVTVTTTDSTVYAEEPKGAEPTEECAPEAAEDSVDQKADSGSSGFVTSHYAMELWLPAECAEFLADAVPFEETDTQLCYEMTRDECLLLQGRLADAGHICSIGMSAEPTTDLALVILAK